MITIYILLGIFGLIFTSIFSAVKEKHGVIVAIVVILIIVFVLEMIGD